MKRILLSSFIAMLLAATAAQAQAVRPELDIHDRQEKGVEQRIAPWDDLDGLIPMVVRESSVGVWRNSRTGDVLIRGNLANVPDGQEIKDKRSCKDEQNRPRSKHRRE